MSTWMVRFGGLNNASDAIRQFNEYLADNEDTVTVKETHVMFDMLGVLWVYALVSGTTVTKEK